ncbi:MAG: SIR2 family NAD-dependent protein deacylase [Candidatus Binatia bacterium]
MALNDGEQPRPNSLSRYPLLGVHHLGIGDIDDEGEIQRRTECMVARALNIGRAVAFVGSGVSRAYDHPSWTSFVADAVRQTLDESSLRGCMSDQTRTLLDAGHQELKARLDAAANTQQSQDVSSTALDGDSATARIADSDRFLLLLEICDATWRRSTEYDRYRRDLAKLFDGAGTECREGSRPSRPDNDPLRLLMEPLRIRRFLTTNYDVEIERAFVDLIGCGYESLGLDAYGNATEHIGKRAAHETAPREWHRVAPHACSLMLDPERPEFLTQFALGAPGYEHGVFHCHGVFKHWESMVITESDYQRMYLQDDAVHRAYRQALNLAFSGNAILFVGAGFNDPDILRPLREFVSEGQSGPRERPLFALTPYRGDENDLGAGRLNSTAIEWRRFLYQRYGVKVWYYANQGGQESKSLCDALKDLARKWSRWWDEWQLKPPIRKAQFHLASHNIMVHHFTKPPDPSFSQLPDEKAIHAALPEHGAVIALGRAGAGKGNLGWRLANGEVGDFGGYTRCFFGTMHFTNEMLSTIEAAAEFLGASTSGGHPLDRLKAALMNGKHLLVLGGVERLLAAATPRDVAGASLPPGADHPLEIGRPATREVERLFEVLEEVARSGKSHVVLTSSIEPVLLRSGTRGTREPLWPVALQGLDSSATEEILARCLVVDAALVQRLHHALRGHTYALGVLSAVVKEYVPEGERQEMIRGLVRRLTASDLSRRAEITIALAIAATTAAFRPDALPPGMGDKRDLVLGTLQRFALFSTPTGTDEIVDSWSAPHSLSTAGLRESVGAVVKHLAKVHLLLQVEPRTSVTDAVQRHERYTAHTVVRQYVLHQLGKRIGEIPGELNRLSLTAFSMDAAVPPVPPPQTPAGHLLIVQCVDNLLGKLENPTDGDHAAKRELLRAAFGLIRARWSATTVPLQFNLPETTPSGRTISHFEGYQRRLLRLGNALRAAHAGEGWFSEQDAPDSIVHVDAHLYADELGWLFNELGMISYSQGMVHDAYSLFRMGQDINTIAEYGPRGASSIDPAIGPVLRGPRWCQSELNLAGVQIEAANLPRARYHLENALRGSQGLGDEEMMARVFGYLGLVHHLSGGYYQAETLYGRAINRLRQQGNRRGLSIFLRHRSDLLRKQKRREAAARDIASSIVTAESGGHMDLVQYARVAEANCQVDAGDIVSHEHLSPTLEFARRVGLPKLEADALKVQAHMALRSRETELAGRLAVSSLAIAASNDMRLRITAGLVLIGRVAATRGDRKAAKAVFQSAIELGHQQGYQMQVEAADRELTRMAAREGAERG